MKVATRVVYQPVVPWLSTQRELSESNRPDRLLGCVFPITIELLRARGLMPRARLKVLTSESAGDKIPNTTDKESELFEADEQPAN